MASLAADRYRLLHTRSEIMLNWPSETYRTVVQWQLLRDQLKEEKAAAREAEEKGCLPPPALAVQTEERLLQVLSSAKSARAYLPSVDAVDSTPPFSTFNKWWRRNLDLQQQLQQAAAAPRRPSRQLKCKPARFAD